MTAIRLATAAAGLGTVLLAGCAIEQEGRVRTGSLKPHAASKPTPKSSADDMRKTFCAQRHVDFHTGKAPGGADTAEKKAAGDRLCEALERQG